VGEPSACGWGPIGFEQAFEPMEVIAVTAPDTVSATAALTVPPVDAMAPVVTVGAPGTSACAMPADASSAGAVGAGGAGGWLSEVAAIRAAVARVAARTCDARLWSGADRHRVLAELEHAVDALVTVRAAVLVAERDAGTWQGSGVRSAEAWWARTSGVGQRAAAAQLRQAGHLDAAPPAIAAAVAEGKVTVEHAAAIGAVVASGTPAQREAMLSAQHQEELLALARSQDAGTFATTVAHRAATVDPAGLERDHQALRRARFLHLSHTPDGTLIKGRLDPITGHRVSLALESLTPRPGADDDRDHGQRCADALDAMATRTLAADPRPGTHVPVQISFLVTEQTWTAARADRDRRRARARATTGAGSRPPGRIDASDGTDSTDDAMAVSCPPATLEDGIPVPATELAAAMCDCEITRIVLDADSVPLDVGRTQRVFTGPQRRAVIARDRQCAWPDCHIHARWSDVHHIAWWERDTGPTSVDNGILLCSYHHHEVHRQDLTITRIRPTGREPAPGVEPPGADARVTYEFRDSAGRIVAPAPRPVATSAAGAGAVRAPGTVTRDRSAPPGSESARPAEHPPPHGHNASLPQPGTQTRDALELEWVEDPFTGMKVPRLFAGR
jgi:hypothetical protein